MKIPIRFKGRIGYGLYGGIVQYYIVGVDGTLAQLGTKLPSPVELEGVIKHAKSAHKKLVANLK